MGQDHQTALVADLLGLQYMVTSLRNESGDSLKSLDLKIGDELQMSWGEQQEPSANEGVYPILQIDPMGDTPSLTEGDRLQSQVLKKGLSKASLIK